MLYFLFFLLLLLFDCSEKQDLRNEKRKLQTPSVESDDYNNIRIELDTNCLSLSNKNEPIFKKALNKAKETIEKLVKVKTLRNGIDYNYHGIEEKTDISQKFVSCNHRLYNSQADLVIFFRNSVPGLDDETDFGLPEIKVYLNNDENNRPVVGIINYHWNSVLDKLDPDSQEEVIYSNLLHEFTHILGFNKTILFNKNLIYKKSPKMRMNSKVFEKYFYKGKNVIERAKKYYNYPNLTELEMDDINGKEARDGSKIHWSERLLLGEYMTPNFYYSEQIISEFTLDLLKDLGWYEINYFTGGLMRFGKNKGENFMTSDCVTQYNMTHLKTNFQNEFCSNIYSFGTCSSGRQSMGFCLNTFPYSTVTNAMEGNYIRDNFDSYFGSGFGSFQEIEYCPFTNSESNYYEAVFSFLGSCKMGSRNITDVSNEYVIQEFNNESFCVLSSIFNITKSNPDDVKNIIRPNCYGISCSERSLTIRVENEYIVCPREGGIININSNYSGLSGYLFCPDYNLICTANVVCNNIYDCVSKNSTVKNTTYDYDYVINKNVSIEMTTNKSDEIEDKDINKNSSFEQSEDGVCPKFCKQCISNKQCIYCDDKHNKYIGTKEDNKTAEIKCNENAPADGYYNFTLNNKQFFYQCIENCKLCYNESKVLCHQCYPTYYINSTSGFPGLCIERIPGCLNYDNKTGVVQQAPDNGNGLSYTHCIECDNSKGYYCLDGNRTICHLNPVSNLHINLTRYGPMETGSNPCLQKCDERFLNCDTCNYSSCVICNNQSNHFINYYGNCLKKIENCLEYNPYKNTSECLRCDEDHDYYCIKENRTFCQYITDTEFTSWSKMNSSLDSCVQRCDELFTEQCLECNYTGCTKCQEGYFIYKGRCYPNMTGCIDNIFNAKNQTECNKCDEAKNYYCFNLTRTECYPIDETTTNISQYFKYTNVSYPCYGPCGSIADHCIE